MKTFIPLLLSIALTSLPANAQSYLSAEEQVFLRDVKETLVKFNNPMASGISDFDKIEYAQKLDEERSI